MEYKEDAGIEINLKSKNIYFTDEELSFISKKLYESTCKRLGMEPYSTSINVLYKGKFISPVEGDWGYFSDLDLSEE